MPNDPHYYHGRPCKRCGGTARDVRSSNCLTCRGKRKGGLKLDLIASRETYHGQPCRNCGTTEKYKSNRACKHCTIERNKQTAIKRREAAAKVPFRERGLDRCLGCGETKNYFFLDYCRECVNKTNNRKDSVYLQRCSSCGEWKTYHFHDFCRKCKAAERKRRQDQEFKDFLNNRGNPY